MSNNGISRMSYSIENRLPYEKTRIEEVRRAIMDHMDPLTIVISSGGCDSRITIKDVANYFECYKVPFELTLSSFRLDGDLNVSRRSIS